MARQRHLSNAPIKEAIIDIKTNFETTVNLDELKQKLDVIKAEYPEVKDLMQKGFSIKQENGNFTDTQIQDTKIGLGYRNPDNTYVAQFRIDGFTLSRLEQYTDWEEFKIEAYRLWNIYKNVTNPKNIHRIAVRYVNILEIEADNTIMEQYLTNPSFILFGNSRLDSALNRSVFYENSFNSSVIFTQALETENNEKQRVILDIDAFKSEIFNLDEDAYLEHFEKLHELKNNIFFEAITEKTAELYE